VKVDVSTCLAYRHLALKGLKDVSDKTYLIVIIRISLNSKLYGILICDLGSKSRKYFTGKI